eukprot:CAMPEP_0172582520 /NCGR_PEP_ID=MMETSP1068-20121228/1978_1 /TAXON_ID=35684 /ORGANISM="Pseudopedinella elastica, Strain CCMP716" /LENGTH=94 /DNA_ID=CAMNT_0013375917 /DNA_START=259 /DNA_END=543 /DNA_ORIENTATION=-
MKGEKNELQRQRRRQIRPGFVSVDAQEEEAPEHPPSQAQPGKISIRPIARKTTQTIEVNQYDSSIVSVIEEEERGVWVDGYFITNDDLGSTPAF